MAALGRLWYQAWIDVPQDPTTRFDGKTVLVTGANTGIGLETAVKLTNLGATKVIIGVRDVEKGKVAKQSIEERTRRAGVVEVEQLDMADYGSIRGFVTRIEKLERLDAVILNAGVLPAKWSLSQYGWNKAVQINTISTVYLALLVLPVLERTAAKHDVTHLEFVGSGLYQLVRIDESRRDRAILDLYNNEHDFGARPAYAFSKLALYCAAKKIALRLGDDPPVIVTNVCPGMVATSLGRDFATGWGMSAGMQLLRFIQRTAEQGSRTLVKGVTLGKGEHGWFWQHDRVQQDAGLLNGEDSEKICQQLWHDILTALQNDNPDMQRIIDKWC